MSQIGYMFLGAGIGAYANAMFLLMAHAFFKALLFLGAGIVIHALGGRAGHPQDGRPAEADAEDVVGDADRRARARRDAAALRVLRQGLDPRRDARARGLVRVPPVRGRHRRHVLHRPLHVPDAVRRLRRRAVRVRAGAPAACGPRSAGRLVDGADGRRARRARSVRRLDPVRRRVDADHQLARHRSPSPSSRRPEARRRSRASAPSPSASPVSASRGGSTRRTGRRRHARGPCSSTSSTSTSCTTGSSTGRRSRSRASSTGRSRARS